MPILSGGRLYQVEVFTPRARGLIARYWGSAVTHFLATGDTSRLKRFRGYRIRGLPFETDPEVIEDFYFSTDFDFQELYEP